MNDIIRIQPTVETRRDFARWGVAQKPKIRTISPSEFAVPAALFAAMPEDILIGALIDGRRYVSPDEDATLGRPEPGASELLGVATPEGLAPGALVGETGPETVIPLQRHVEFEAVPGDVLPEPPESTNGPDSVPLPPADVENEAQTGDGDSEETAPFACDLCLRDYPTQRGRDTHRRQKHPEA